MKKIIFSCLVLAMAGIINLTCIVSADDYLTPQKIVIQAENPDTYYDTTPGKSNPSMLDGYGDLDVTTSKDGNIAVSFMYGEWMRYKVDVAESATYKLSMYIGITKDCSVNVWINSKNAKGEDVDVYQAVKKTVPNTGSYNTFRDTFVTYVNLAAGTNYIKISNELSPLMKYEAISFDYLSLEKIIYTGDEDEILFEGASYNAGGEGVGYHDSTATTDTTFKNGDTVEMTVENNSERIITFAGSEWFNYDLIVQKPTVCKLYISGGTTASSGVSVAVNDGTPATYTLPSTGATTTRPYMYVGKIALAEGKNTIRITNSGTSSIAYKGFKLVPIIQLTEEAERQILSNLLSTQNSLDVQSFFQNNERNFDLSLSQDLIGISNQDLFYSHFISARYDTVDDLLTAYEYFLLFETINQGNSDTVKSFLGDGVKCSMLGIEKKKTDLIIVRRAEFINEIVALDDAASVKEFLTNLDSIFSIWLKTEYGKNDAPILSASSQNLYVGQGIVIPVGFAGSQKDIKKVSYILECDNNEILDGIKTELSIPGQSTVQVFDKKAIVTIEANSVLLQVDLLGSIICNAPGKVPAFSIVINGTVEYGIKMSDGQYCYISSDAESKTITINISENNSKGTTRKSSAVGARSSGHLVIKEDPIQQQIPVVEDNKFEFSDLQGVSWAEESIRELLKRKIISESEDKKFYPNNSVTREEFVKMLMTSLKAVKTDVKTKLKDIDEGKWYYPYVASAEEYGLVSGDENGFFGIGEKITRQDMAVLLSRTIQHLGYSPTEGKPDVFADDENIAVYAKQSIYMMRDMKIISGIGNNLFVPNEYVTRSMASKVIFEMIKAVGI